MPPIPGISPRLTSGSPKYEFSDAIIISERRANSKPPPKAFPLTAATIGFLTDLNAFYKTWKI